MYQVDTRCTGIGSHVVTAFKQRPHTSSERMCLQLTRTRHLSRCGLELPKQRATVLSPHLHAPIPDAAFSREKTGACPFKCRTSYCPHVPTQGPGCERRSCSEQAAASVACVMLQGLVTLSATIAIQNACCVSVLMRVLRSRRLRLSTKSLSRGVCKAGGSCWNQDVDAALRNAGSEGTPEVGSAAAVWCVRAGALA